MEGLGQGTAAAGQLMSDQHLSDTLGAGGATVTGMAGLTRDLIDIHDHGSTVNNTVSAVSNVTAAGGGALTMAGVEGVSSVTGPVGLALTSAQILHAAGNRDAAVRGDYGVRQVTQRGVNGGAVVNRDIDDDAVMQGGRSYRNDIAHGHGEVYSQTHAALVGLGTEARGIVNSNVTSARDAAYGMRPGQPLSPVARALGVDHVYTPTELMSMPSYDLDHPPPARTR
jgi:hypothetical protein